MEYGRTFGGREMGNGKDSAESVLDIIEANYEFLADPDALDNLVLQWAQRIAKVDRKEIDSIEHPLLLRHLRSLSNTNGRTAETLPEDPYASIVHEVTGPAVVISASKLVATLNDSASQVWNARRGDVLDMHWLDPISQSDFEAICRAANGSGNRGHVVLQTRNDPQISGLAEAFFVRRREAQHGRYPGASV